MSNGFPSFVPIQDVYLTKLDYAGPQPHEEVYRAYNGEKSSYKRVARQGFGYGVGIPLVAGQRQGHPSKFSFHKLSGRFTKY